jgi:hydrogenase/urease accessory protein HupE
VRTAQYAVVIGGAVSSVFIATEASAHVQIEGVSDFNAGLLHPFLTMPHALALVAFGLICGQRNARMLPFGLPSLVCGSILGSIAAALGQTVPAASALLTALALLAGLGVAVNPPLPPGTAIILGALIGALIGIDSFPEGPFITVASGLSGTAIGVILLYLNLAGLAFFAKAEWQAIGIRVAGSWASAAAILNIALLFRK